MDERLKRAKQIVHNQPDEALAICNDILNEEFDSILGQQALFMSGYIMMEAERYGLAYHIYERCAQLSPNVSEIYSNMGMCLEEFDPQKAIKMFRKAQQLNPKNAHSMANEGLMMLLTANPHKCIELSLKALAIDPKLRSAKHNMGLAQIMLKQWKEGWRNYYDTHGVKHREKRDYGLPEWDGKSEGKVIVYDEQGVGDSIMFASCLSDITATNDIVLDCDSRLKKVYKDSFDFPVYGTRFKTETPLVDDHPDAKYQIAIGQLPHFYRNTDDSFPGTPYLKADRDQSLMWGALFDTFKGKKIGIAWRGGLRSTGERKRSLELKDFEPLFDDDNTFISLEYKAVNQQEIDEYGIKSYPKTTGKGKDLDGLFALVSQLDFVVSCCTSVIYVAGALGIPCYVMVPDEPGYRYGIDGGFPWYKSVKLVRKRKGQSWRKVTNKIKEMIC